MYKSTTSDSSVQKTLKSEIKKTWGKLTDEEIGFQESNPGKFFEAVKTKYSINRDEAEKTVKKLETECASACSTSSGKDSSAASGQMAKAANDSSAGLPKAANS